MNHIILPLYPKTKMPTKEVTACVPATTVKLLVCPMIALAMRPISPLRRAYQQSCDRPRAAPWRPGGTVLRGRLPTPQIYVWVQNWVDKEVKYGQMTGVHQFPPKVARIWL